MNLFDFVYDRIYFPKEHKIRFFEAFSGIGCQAMALKKITDNFEIVGISEIDKYALQSYKAIHGDVKNYGGIGSFERFPKDIDICTWSFPCQDISLAGKQRGLVDGTRSNYGYEFLETVKRTPKEERPKVLIMENVKALFSEKFIEDWREIQNRLQELGYMSYAEVLNAKDYGVAQNRERIFIVSVLGEFNYVFPEPKPLTKLLKDYLEETVDEKYYLSEKQITQIQNWKSYQNPLDDVLCKESICPTITTRIAESPDGGINASMKLISEEISTNLNVNKLGNVNPSGNVMNGNVYDSNGLIPTIKTTAGQQPEDNFVLIPEATTKGFVKAYDGDGVYVNRPHQKRGCVQPGMTQTIKTDPSDIGVIVKVGNPSDIGVVVNVNKVIRVGGMYDDKNGKHQAGSIYDENGLSPTIDTVQGGNRMPLVADKSITIRKLTPRECWRLMGIRDEDFDKAQASGMSNAQLYKQAGNGIVVDVFEAILEKMIERTKSK